MGSGYGRMQFADYLVSYALQTLNRCLLKVSTSPELSCKDEKMLNEHLSHLQSLWQMMQLSVGRLTHEQATARLREAQQLLGSPTPALAAGRQLLEFAQEKDVAVLQLLVSRLEATPPAVALHRRERLGQLLQLESACWRDHLPLRHVPEADLVEHGMGRAYRKAQRLVRRLDRERPPEAEPAGPKRLRRTARWIEHTANHLDLVRTSLADTGRAQRWHLGRLHGKILQQLDLELFARLAVEQELKPKQLARIGKLVHRQREHIDKQRRKLAVGAFAPSANEYVAQARRAVEQLGLKEITLLPLDAVEAG